LEEYPSQFNRRTAALIREEYERWASTTARLLDHIDRFELVSGPLADSDALRNAYGKTRARLSVSLDEMENSLLALSEGRVISAEGVRRELQLRIH